MSAPEYTDITPGERLAVERAPDGKSAILWEERRRPGGTWQRRDMMGRVKRLLITVHYGYVLGDVQQLVDCAWKTLHTIGLLPGSVDDAIAGFIDASVADAAARMAERKLATMKGAAS
jgi:hypothetical protein